LTIATVIHIGAMSDPDYTVVCIAQV